MSRPRHIVMVNDFGSWGGAEKIFLASAQALATEFKVSVVLGTSGRLMQSLSELGVEVVLEPLPAQRTRILALLGWGHRVARIVRRFSPDAVLLNTLLCQSFVTPWIATRGPIIWHEHNIQTSKLRRVVRNLMAVAVRRVVAVSSAAANRYWSLNQSRIRIVRNGLVASSSSRMLPEMGSRITFVIPSVLRPWKGHAVAIQAFADFVRQHPNAMLRILGDSTHPSESGYRAELELLVQELGVSPQVVFVGHVADVSAEMTAADAVIVPSVKPDPFPTVVLEAMHLGVPVIASATGGITEQIEDDATGLLVAPGDSGALWAAMESFAAMTRRQRDSLAAAAQARARSLFSSERYASEFVHVVQRCFNAP